MNKLLASFLIDTVTPRECAGSVSYTHLDVYKRQNYNLVPILNVYENIVLPVELDGDTVDQKFLDEIVHLPVSYTHLDVYKRQECNSERYRR